MSSATPPFDRAIALACAMATLRGRWLHVRCACLHSSSPSVQFLLGNGHARPGQSLADVVVCLRCDGCGGRPATVHMSETMYPPDVRGNVVPGWQMLLHGVEADPVICQRQS